MLFYLSRNTITKAKDLINFYNGSCRKKRCKLDFKTTNNDVITRSHHLL